MKCVSNMFAYGHTYEYILNLHYLDFLNIVKFMNYEPKDELSESQKDAVSEMKARRAMEKKKHGGRHKSKY